MQDSGAKVRIYKDKLPFSDERVILMQGSQQNIAKCVVVLADLLMQVLTSSHICFKSTQLSFFKLHRPSVIINLYFPQFPCMYQYTQYCPQSERSDLDCGGYAHIGEFAHTGGSETSMGAYNTSHVGVL